MSSQHEWEPGDVAIATYCGEPNVRVSRYDDLVSGWARLTDPDDYVNDGAEHGGFRVTDARPLVVIDPEDREQVERLWRAWADLAPDHRLAQDNMQAALRSLIDPPRPDEPQGLGAVVEDADGKRWVRNEDTHPQCWYAPSESATWDGIDSPKILSPGWSE